MLPRNGGEMAVPVRTPHSHLPEWHCGMALARHGDLATPFYRDVYPSRELSVYKRYDT